MEFVRPPWYVTAFSVALLATLLAVVVGLTVLTGRKRWGFLLPVAVLSWFVANTWLTGLTAPSRVFEFKTLPYELMHVPVGYEVRFCDIRLVGHERAELAAINHYAIGLYGAPERVRQLQEPPSVVRLYLAGAESEANGRQAFTVIRTVEVDLQAGMQLMPDLDRLAVTLTRVEE